MMCDDVGSRSNAANGWQTLHEHSKREGDGLEPADRKSNWHSYFLIRPDIFYMFLIRLLREARISIEV